MKLKKVIFIPTQTNIRKNKYIIEQKMNIPDII